MYSVLIVDDEKLERTALRLIIEKTMPAFQVIGEARNGNEAVDLAIGLRPDIILMDIKMPGRSGLEAAEEIIKAHPEARVIVLSAFDYFDYAQKALHVGTVGYLLKPVRPRELKKVLDACIGKMEERARLLEENRRIREQLSELWPYIQSSFIYDLVNGNISSEQELKQRASILGIDLFPALVMVLGIEKTGTVAESTNEFENQLTRQRVYGVIQDVFRDCSSVLVTPVMAEKFVLLIPSVCKNGAETFYSFCHRKGKAIIRQLSENGISISIGAGRCYEDALKIRKSYLEALENQRGSSFAGGNEIFTCFNCSSTACQQLCEDHYLKGSELFDLIGAGDWEGLARAIDLTWENIRNSNLGEELQKATALELLVILYRVVATSTFATQPMAVLSLNNIRNLMDSNNISQLGESFRAAVNEIIDVIKGKKDIAASIVRVTQNYIRENYSREITLEDAARHVHVSPCYLSRIFSKEAGLSFKKYLTNTKLNYAKKLLLLTYKPVSEIAFDAGYRDVSYFCRVFKQSQGLSPNEYRAAYRSRGGFG